jgi:hypothetical protein
MVVVVARAFLVRMRILLSDTAAADDAVDNASVPGAGDDMPSAADTYRDGGGGVDRSGTVVLFRPDHDTRSV